MRALPFLRFPLKEEQTRAIIKKYPTPFHLYDEKGIRVQARKLMKAYSWMPGFKNYFAVKALPNPFILKILKQEGFGADCSSLPELVLAEKAGMEIMFSSNNTPAQELKEARKLNVIINLDDISHISFLEKHAGLPELLCFRYNPGPERTGNAIIGDPKEAKYGFTREQLFEGYRICKAKGVKRFGLHTMVVSNELDPNHLIQTARMLFEIVLEVRKKLGITIAFVNLGGGIGIPYKPDEKPVDLEAVSKGIKKHYDAMIRENGLHPLKIVMECGRVVTGPYGWLVTRVRHIKHTYKDFVGVDATMADLMRPALYRAYHHIEVMGKEKQPKSHRYDVTGSLCENNDKFAIDRPLPKIEQGDILIIYNTGAHGHAMGFNYNGKLRHAELLLRENKEVMEIRRSESMEDYFATLDFDKLKEFC